MTQKTEEKAEGDRKKTDHRPPTRKRTTACDTRAGAGFEELRRAGIGADIEPAIERVLAVSKVSNPASRGRPSPEDHYQALRAQPFVPSAGSVLLVDDVVARGSTLLACAAQLLERVPHLELRALAIARVDLRADLAVAGDAVQTLIQTITRYPSGKLWRN